MFMQKQHTADLTVHSALPARASISSPASTIPANLTQTNSADSGIPAKRKLARGHRIFEMEQHKQGLGQNGFSRLGDKNENF